MFRVLYKSELIPTDELGLRCEESLLQAAAVVQEMCLNILPGEEAVMALGCRWVCEEEPV